jgi:HD-GYP domain-containing protein (c-di-GMP phosphodiesterase class II)
LSPATRAATRVVAARLRDVGKLALPLELLTKPGPLKRDEWAVIHTHPQRGAALLIEARIISVCAAWSAIRSDRLHTPTRSIGKALAALRIGAGAQFDPDVVEAFFEVTDTEHGRLLELAVAA